MAEEDHGDSRDSGRNLNRSALSPSYSPVATDQSDESSASHRLPESVKGALWRPFTLRPTTLFLFLLSTIGLITTTEALNYISARNGALAFADPLRGFSVAQIFCYRYLPQMVTVLYGIGWAAVDLDVKRLEPYFQLSKPGGASASDSILLHYPFDFLPLVPLTAAKRKHWNVFAAGTALVLIFAVITPLQSSFLTRELVAKEIPTRFIPTAKLSSYGNQRGILNSTFFYSSYGVTWLDEKLAGFMTREFVAIPFKPANSNDDKIGRSNESWTAVTTGYQTYVDCAPAVIIEPDWRNGRTYYNFTTDGFSYRFHQNTSRDMIYLRLNSRVAPHSLEEPGPTTKDIFLGIWTKSRLASNKSRDIDVTGIFCSTRYSYADVDITVDATTLDITRSRFIGEPKPLSAKDEIIDINLFEEYLRVPGSKISSKLFSDRVPLTQARYENWNLSDPSPVIGYAIGLENKTFDDFRDPVIFGAAMNKTHKLLFNYAVRVMFRDEDRPKQVNGTSVTRKEGIVVVPVVAHILAGFLSAVAICLVSVIFLSYNRRNNLRSDPDTLATTMSIVARSPQLLKDFTGADNCPDIGRCIKRRRYKLWDGVGGHRLDITDSSDATPSGGSHESSTKSHDGRGTGPWVLSAGMGVCTTICSAGLLVILAVLFRSSQKYSGLPTLSNHRLVIQFIFSFTPTAIAMLIEPLWVVVTRYLALYQPWTELSRGHSSSAASLGLKYTNLPPVLIAPRALAGGHCILSLASAVVLASNGLAVALGGIFDTGPRQVSAATAFEFRLSPNIDSRIQTGGPIRPGSIMLTGTFAKDGEEPWLIALTNMTSTSLPPWTAPEFYFLPFEWNTTAGNTSDLRSANTWGFGVNLTCKLLAGDVYGQQSRVGSSYYGWSAQAELNVTIPMANGSEVRCNNSRPLVGGPEITGRFAGEYLISLGAADSDDQEADNFCHSFLVMGWIRGSVIDESSKYSNFTVDTRTYENTTILCAQQISSAKFNVVVDNKGRVQMFKRLTPFSYDTSSVFNHSTTAESFKAQLSVLSRTNWNGQKDTGSIHIDKYPGILPHYLIESRGFGHFYDPSTPPPPFEDAQRAFRGFYSWFAPIVIGQNSERIFRSTTKDGGRRPQVPGKMISVQNRVSMDPIMFYIAIALLGFSTLASAVIFSSCPKRFLPRLPDTLAAEIGFIYASEALEDTAGTAHMSSAMRERHLANLGWEYGYGEFMGKDGELHLGVERMGPIDDFKEL